MTQIIQMLNPLCFIRSKCVCINIKLKINMITSKLDMKVRK